MRIAVTGAAGRVGRAVVTAAAGAGHTVVEIDRPGAGYPAAPVSGHARHAIDVTRYDDLLRAVEGCDALVHLAAHTDPTGTVPDQVVHDDNVVGSYHALRTAAEHGIDRVCLASSVNAVGGVYSRRPRYDYFPVDERHPTYSEDPYSLSKWIGEAQADCFGRRYESMSIVSLRLHWVRDTPPGTLPGEESRRAPLARHLWGYTLRSAAARACLLALDVSWRGHEVCYVVAPDTGLDIPSMELYRRHYPRVPLRAALPGNRGFFDCAKAERLLGWRHDESRA